MPGSFFSITVVGTHRRLDLRLPVDVPVGELTSELVTLLDEPVDGAPPRWGLVRLGGDVLDAERDLAAQGVPAGAMLFVRDLGVVEPPTAVDDYPSAVAAVVEASAGLWSPAAFQAMLVLAAVAWVLGAGVLAASALASGTASDQSGLLAAGVGLAAVAVGRLLGAPRAAVALALSALPLWAVAGIGASLQLGQVGMTAAGGAVVAVGLGGLAAAAAAEEGVAPAVGLVAVSGPWSLTLALSGWLGHGLVAGAAILALAALAALRLSPWTAIRVAGLEDERTPAALAARALRVRRLLASFNLCMAVTLASACVVLVMQGSPWARALAVTAALAALLHGRRRRFAVEVAPLWGVALATLATFELQVPAALDQRLQLLAGTAGALAVLGLLGRRVRLPVGLRRQLERLEALAAAATVPVLFGLLGVYDAAARFAGRFG